MEAKYSIRRQQTSDGLRKAIFVVALVGYSSVEHRMISIGRVKLIYT